MKPKVVISHELPADWLTPLEGLVDFVVGPSTAIEAGFSADLLPDLADAVGLLTMLTVKVNDALLDQAPKLRVVSQMAVGVDNISVEACTARGIHVGNTPGTMVDATADIALGLLLAMARQFPISSQDAREGRWGTWSPTQWLGMELRGATLGIIGMGRIGQATAERAKAFGMKIVYHNRRRDVSAEKSLNATYLPLDDLLQASDVVSLHTPLTPETHHLINFERLALMQPSAFLINTARGGVVDSDALVAALQSGMIAGAGLDVTDPEPLPPAHALYQLPNCFITPHIGSATAQTRKRMAHVACENLLAGVFEKPLPFPVR